MYTQAEITPYLEDCEAVTGNPTTRYICPLTLEPCEPHEISQGHIINKKIPYAHNVKVPVRTRPDNFYGTRVEDSFIRFARLRRLPCRGDEDADRHLRCGVWLGRVSRDVR